MPLNKLKISDEQVKQAEEQGLISADRHIEVPIALVSKKFSEAASRWSTTEQELFALVHAFTKLERLLTYKPITVMTDHDNLVKIKNGALGSTAKATRWRQFLASFPFFIKHIKGELNIVADYLSRCWDAEPEVSNTCAAMTSADKQHTFTTVKEVLDHVHQQPGGHRGAKATWTAQQNLFRGSKISMQTVRDYVDECAVCQKLRAPPQVMQSVNKALPVYHTRAVVHCDVLTLEEDIHSNKYAFVFVNAVTKYVHIFPTKDKASSNFTDAIIQYMATVGLVDLFWADGGGEFVEKTNERLLKHLGTGLTYTLAGRPQANSIVERVNREILQECRLMMRTSTTWNRWSEPAVISLIQLILNTRQHSATGYTPIELTYGTEAKRYFVKPEQPSSKGAVAALEAFDEHLRAINEEAVNNIETAQKKRLKKQPDNVVRFNRGDLVLYNPTSNTPFRKSKLQADRLGPYEVIGQPKTVGSARWRSEDPVYSNTVFCKHVNSDMEVKFHHTTLSIFTGTLVEAKALQRMDAREFKVVRISGHRGNVRIKRDTEYEVTYEDGTTEWQPWAIMNQTEAFERYCEKYTWGARMLSTETQWKEQCEAVQDANTRTKEAIQALNQEQKPVLNEIMFISAFHWNNATFNVISGEYYGNNEPFGLQLHHKEPMLRAKVSKIQQRTLELELVDITHVVKNTMINYRKDIKLMDFVTYCRKQIDDKHQLVIPPREVQWIPFTAVLLQNLVMPQKRRGNAKVPLRVR